MVVESWLKKMEMAPKTKAHIRGVMHLMFECAGRWELFNDRRNPMQMVRVKDSTKRRQRPTVLTVTEYEAILAMLKEPYRTMVIVAQCLGLRVSEIAALQWQDFDIEHQQLLVQRSIVNGQVGDCQNGVFTGPRTASRIACEGSARLEQASPANGRRLGLRKPSDG